jgi:hypothetical protein
LLCNPKPRRDVKIPCFQPFFNLGSLLSRTKSKSDRRNPKEISFVEKIPVQFAGLKARDVKARLKARVRFAQYSEPCKGDTKPQGF